MAATVHLGFELGCSFLGRSTPFPSHATRKGSQREGQASSSLSFTIASMNHPICSAYSHGFDVLFFRRQGGGPQGGSGCSCKRCSKRRGSLPWKMEALWTAPTRPWVGMPTPCDDQERDLFAAITVVSIGDGLTASFWDSNWIGGAPLRISFPLLFACSHRKGRWVAHAIAGHQWIADLCRDNTTQFMSQFLAAWRLLAQAPPLLTNAPDSIRWTPSPNSIVYTKSAYLLHFIGRSCSDLPDLVWCGLAAWQNCNGIAGALKADHWALTDFLGCILDLSADGHKKGVNSLFILTCWTIWQERNNRVFHVFIKDAAQD
ncbi:hypothetical protein BRADI_5g12293v3 [Brachypodium distachyon]|uniref:Reverse transcriptase zinc-binding domain-containing protein n=1 Tax=Brachypodium distachyon TaxID=15368 RepID=A0A2K2CGR7_BRADI|nr:hypothetical protein BRADI_5g12293v3 [Brachypodium distachyon]